MRHKGLFVTGVGTGIGKTAAAGAIAHLLRKNGYDVGVMKPVQTGTGPKAKNPDIAFLKQMAGSNDPVQLCVPYIFKAPLSPYHAAAMEKRSVRVAAIADAFNALLRKNDLVIMEGAGGLIVPLTKETFWPDLIRALNVPVLIVTHPELGMIHQTISTVMAAEMYGLEMAGIMIVEKTKKKHPPLDIKWLEKRTGLPVLGVLPYTTSLKRGKTDYGRFRSHVEKNIKPKAIIDFLERAKCSREHRLLEELDKKNVWRPFTQMREWQGENEVIIDSGFGTGLTDLYGKTYYDGQSSYWVNIHGHGNARLTRTLTRQAARLEHATFLGLGNKPAIELAQRLLELAPDELAKVFYSDNGSTAVEVGMKMAYQYFRQLDPPQAKRTRFVALEQAYHGDTLGAVAVGGIETYRDKFDGILPEVLFAPSPYCYRCTLDKAFPECSLACARKMEEMIEKDHSEIAAFIIEPMVQCPGGIITAPHGYLKRVREVCNRYGILMIADEVAVGFGRTGRMFACEHEDVCPDIMALSKSMAAGVLPLAATLVTQKVYDAFLGAYDERKTFFHGHTFTGHPPACAVALENLDLFKKKKIIRSLEEKSQFLRDNLIRFDNLPCVGDIRQLGMIVGIELVKDRETREPFKPSLRIGHQVILEARKRGLLIRPLGDIIVFFPILAARAKEIKNMTDIIYDSISAVTGSFEESIKIE